MNIKLSLLATVLLVSLSSLAQAQNDVKISALAVSENIFMLTGQGGNIGVFVGEDGTFVVDDQYAPLTDKILAAIKSVGGDTPRFLLNTHYHGDHTGGNENLGKAGVLIVSHDNVRSRLKDGSFIQTFQMKAPPANKAALPLLTFSSDMHFHINNDSVQAIHVSNAHTDGDSFIYFKSANVVHAGDIFFNGFYPFIDGAHGGSVHGTIAAVDAILALTDAQSKIIPGHGPLAVKADLKAYRDMLDTAYSRLLKLKNAGMSLQQAIAEKPLADLEPTWGDGFLNGDKWVEVVYPVIY